MDLATAKATAGNDRASAETFCALVQGRLLSRAYRLPPGAPGAASPGSVLRVVQCVRLMLRHGPFVARLGEIAGAAEALGDKFRAYADLHRAHSDVSLAEPADGVRDEASKDADASSATSPFAFREEILRELASVFKKVATTFTNDAARGGTDASSTKVDPPDENLPDAAHVVAIGLLSTRDPSLLASALVILRATTSRALAPVPRARRRARRLLPPPGRRAPRVRGAVRPARRGRAAEPEPARGGARRRARAPARARGARAHPEPRRRRGGAGAAGRGARWRFACCAGCFRTARRSRRRARRARPRW